MPRATPQLDESTTTHSQPSDESTITQSQPLDESTTGHSHPQKCCGRINEPHQSARDGTQSELIYNCSSSADRYPDALIFVATDDRIYLRRLLRQYGRYRASPSSLASVHKVERSDTQQGRVVFHSMGYETNNVISDSTISSYRKGAEVHSSPTAMAPAVTPCAFQVLVDALLLSRCDFLIKTTSAVAEFAIWVNLALHHAHIDLQKEDRFRSQVLSLCAPAFGPPASRRARALRCCRGTPC